MNEKTSTTATTKPGTKGLHMDRTKSNNEGRNNLINSDLLAKLVAGITSPRDKALTLLMIDTALRAGEVVQLDIDSIGFGSGQESGGSGVNSGTCTTRAYASIPGRRFCFTAQTADALAAYCGERDNDGSPALFVSKNGTRLSLHSVSRIIHYWCDRVGIERFPLHNLRHRLA